jgi:hypothetical protein
LALLADNATRCSICRRTLLVGEQAHVYQDGRTRSIQPVCKLCTPRAHRAGWEPLGEQQVHRTTRLRTSPAVVGKGQPERLVRRLHLQMERLQHELRETQGEDAPAEAGAAASDARVEELVRQLDEARDAATRLQAQMATRDARIGQLERELEEAQAAQATLLRARRREADPAYLCGIAAEVFNRSPEAAGVARLAAEHGSPLVRLEADGIGLPRAVLLTFAWGDHRAAFRVSCDLVGRLFDVEISHGAGRVDRSGLPFQPNARLVDGRVQVDV